MFWNKSSACGVDDECRSWTWFPRNGLGVSPSRYMLKTLGAVTRSPTAVAVAVAGCCVPSNSGIAPSIHKRN
jgi:hypothetical protein